MPKYIENTTYEDFQSEWIAEIEKVASAVERDRIFSIKLAREWLDVDPDEDEFVYIDGSDDAGIDIAYLSHGSDNETETDPGSEEQDGDTWYLLQSKYESSISGANTIRRDADKVFATLEGRSRLSIDAEKVAEKLRNFMQQKSYGKDKIVLVIASVNALNDSQLAQLDEIRRLGRSKMPVDGPTFDVESATVQTVYENVTEAKPSQLTMVLRGRFEGLGEKAWVGTVSLKDLYEFLREYRKQTGDFDRLYENNVRRFLGMTKSRNRINFGIRETLINEPERFGIYNNGITLVTDRFDRQVRSPLVHRISNPEVVNGCQTTSTLFNVVDQRLDGGTELDTERDEWESKLRTTSIVVKVVLSNEPSELEKITRFTNSQSAVLQRDLVALNEDYREWHDEMAKSHSRYLEIQRGAWNARKAYERQHPDKQPRFTDQPNDEPINANDMIKVFGAGWLGYAGTAARTGAPFIPSAQNSSTDGSVFREITRLPKFGADDLLAAHCLYAWGKNEGYARRGSSINRGHTRYLFYYTYIELLRSIMARTISTEDVQSHELSLATLRLIEEGNDRFQSLCKAASDVIDRYIPAHDPDNAPHRQDLEHSDAATVENFFQSTRLNKMNITTKAPSYNALLGETIAAMGFAFGGSVSPRDELREILVDLVR